MGAWLLKNGLYEQPAVPDAAQKLTGFPVRPVGLNGQASRGGAGQAGAGSFSLFELKKREPPFFSFVKRKERRFSI